MIDSMQSLKQIFHNYLLCLARNNFKCISGKLVPRRCWADIQSA